mgnify:FL=1
MNHTPKRTVKAIIKIRPGHFQEVAIDHEKATEFAKGMDFTRRLSRTIKEACFLEEFRNHGEFVRELVKQSEMRVANLVAGKEKPLSEADYIQRSIEARDAIYDRKLPDKKRGKMEREMAEIYNRNGPVWSTIISIKYDILQEIHARQIIPKEEFRRFVNRFTNAFLESSEIVRAPPERQ